jgi:plasmid stability protein
MANVLIRDVPEHVVKSLKGRAAQQHRSLQQELRLILEEAAGIAAHKTLRAGRRIRGKLARSGRAFSDSATLLREDRAR